MGLYNFSICIWVMFIILFVFGEGLGIFLKVWWFKRRKEVGGWGYYRVDLWGLGLLDIR